MTSPTTTMPLLEANDVNPERARAILAEALSGADDGELYMERSESESFVFDDGRLKSAAYDSGEGFGLRVVAGETAGYAHASEITEATIGPSRRPPTPPGPRWRRPIDSRVEAWDVPGLAAHLPKPFLSAP